MRRIVILIVLLIFSTGCGRKEKVPGGAGEPGSITFKAIVVAQKDKSLSVIVTDGDKGFQRFDPVQVGYDKKIEAAMGDLVEIEFNGMIAESYPCQIGADSIIILKKASGDWPATADISQNYKAEEAIKDHCFTVFRDRTESKELLDRFIDNSGMGIISFLREAAYTVEGDPIITDYLYDGEMYYIFEDVSRDKFGSGEKLYKYEYLYLNLYEKGESKTYYFANRNDITDEEYEKSLDGSNDKAAPDIFPLYYEASEVNKK